jgi:DNA-binding transcriptional ArsR family regulator/L-amino acid N-acyltransferase YncA
MTVTHEHTAGLLPPEDAETYAAWFACLAEPTRVRLLHAIATYPGAMSVGQLAEAVGVRQPTVSHHLRKLAEVGFVTTSRVGTSTRVAVNAACCTGLPHAADAVMGMLAARPCCPTEVPEDVTVRALADADLPAVRRLHAAGAAAGDVLAEDGDPEAGAESDPETGAESDRETGLDTGLDTGWLDGHAWVAERDGAIVGWAAAWPVSRLSAYAGVAETRVHVAEAERGRGVGKALARTQVVEADLAGLWTLQASVAGRRTGCCPRTRRRSPCCTRRATGPSPSANGSSGTGASGGTWCSSNAASTTPPTPPQTAVSRTCPTPSYGPPPTPAPAPPPTPRLTA